MSASSSPATTFTLPATLSGSPPLTDREAVADALYRAALGWDTNNSSGLLETAFTPDSKFEINGQTMDGLPKDASSGLARVLNLDTSHLVTNVRVSLGDEGGNKNKASLTATVLSQHYALGEGVMQGDKKMLLAGSLYFGDLVRDDDVEQGGDGLWRFKYLKAKSLWAEGDWGVVGSPKGAGQVE